MTLEEAWKLFVVVTLLIQVGVNWTLWRVNRLQSRFNREVLGMFASLREGRALRDELERRRVAREAPRGGGLRGV